MRNSTFAARAIHYSWHTFAGIGVRHWLPLSTHIQLVSIQTEWPCWSYASFFKTTHLVIRRNERNTQYGNQSIMVIMMHLVGLQVVIIPSRRIGRSNSIVILIETLFATLSSKACVCACVANRWSIPIIGIGKSHGCLPSNPALRKKLS